VPLERSTALAFSFAINCHGTLRRRLSALRALSQTASRWPLLASPLFRFTLFYNDQKPQAQNNHSATETACVHL
jgi:hypothetical protein